MKSVIQNVEQPRQLSLGEKFISVLFRALPIKHGKHRLLDHFSPSVWTKETAPVFIKLHGREIIVDPCDLVGWHFAILKSFDPEVTEILEKACDPEIEEVLWDIGANKGACFCGLATKLPLLKVVAIEPQAQLSSNNIINLQSVCAGRYEYVQAGIGEQEEDLMLVIPKSNLGRASLHLEKNDPEDLQELIKIRTALQVAESSQFGWPSIIKIDVEGHEPQVFRSLAACFESKRCKVVIFENHEPEIEAFDTARMLTEPHGYIIYGIKKTIWSTKLILARQHLQNVTDYAVIRSDLVLENKRLATLISS